MEQSGSSTWNSLLLIILFLTGKRFAPFEDIIFSLDRRALLDILFIVFCVAQFTQHFYGRSLDY